MQHKRGTRWLTTFLLCLIPPVCLFAQPTLQTFGVQLQYGRPVYPLPSNVALGLFNPDPLLDVAYYANGKVQVFQNMGNGYFDRVFDRQVNGDVAKMEWRKSNYFNEMIYDQTSWGDLYLTFTDGHSEKISHDQMINANKSFASLPQTTNSFPPLNFREVWRSREQNQPVTALLIDDIDNDGKTELIYYYYSQRTLGDTSRLVIYEHVSDNNYVVDWDTLLHNGGGWPYCISDVDRNGKKEIAIISTTTNGIAFLECSGPRQYRMCESNLIFTSPGYIFKAMETDVDHDGRKEICVQHSDPSAPSGQDATLIYVAEFGGRGADGFYGFSTQELARYAPYTFDFAVGQVDGGGTEEIVPAGGSFGAYEPVDVDYLWRNTGGQWRTRRIYTGLESGTGAVMFVNTDADSTLEFFSGAPGPIGHGSAFLLDYVRDTTWRVVFADSSLRNAPLWVNSGMLDGQFVVAGANTWNRVQLDTLFTELHTYTPGGQVFGIWRQDSIYINNFYFLDIDHDMKTDLIFPQTSSGLGYPWIPPAIRDYESQAPLQVKEFGNLSDFELSQNYPNPFNPVTTIEYSLPEKEFLSIAIYNLLGAEIAILVNGLQESGKHGVVWDASGFPSGVYFYQLKTSSRSVTKKMLLVR